MDIKLDLIKKRVLEEISLHFGEFEIDTSEITDTIAIKALSEIQKILNSGEDDFMIVENTMAVFDKYNLSFTDCHDF